MEALLAFPSIATHADPSSWLTACWAEPWPQLGSTQELCTSDGDPLDRGRFSQLPSSGTCWQQQGLHKLTLRSSSSFCPKGLAAILSCQHRGPSTRAAAPVLPSASDKKTRGWSQSLWPPSTCFNLPRQTGGLVHCPLRQVIVADPSKT